MTEKELIKAIEYLVKKYAPNRNDIIETIKNNPGSAKGVMYDLSMAKNREYDNEDHDLIANISFYFIWNILSTLREVPNAEKYLCKA